VLIRGVQFEFGYCVCGTARIAELRKLLKRIDFRARPGTDSRRRLTEIASEPDSSLRGGFPQRTR